MTKRRTAQQIEKDISAIKEAAKTAKSITELGRITGLSFDQVITSLNHHPIIKKRILTEIETNKAKNSSTVSVKPKASRLLPIISEDTDEKWVVICDCPALMHGLRRCSATSIVIPQFVESNLVSIAAYSDEEGIKAQNVLLQINTLTDWCTVAPRLSEDTLLIDPPKEKYFTWRAKALVALACKYWADGYFVEIKTKTREIFELATLQECLTVNFVPADEES